MTMGATLGWPTATVLLGFLVMTALVVILGTSSTARYEFERNGARTPQQSPAPAPAPAPTLAASLATCVAVQTTTRATLLIARVVFWSRVASDAAK